MGAGCCWLVERVVGDIASSTEVVGVETESYSTVVDFSPSIAFTLLSFCFAIKEN